MAWVKLQVSHGGCDVRRPVDDYPPVWEIHEVNRQWFISLMLVGCHAPEASPIDAALEDAARLEDGAIEDASIDGSTSVVRVSVAAHRFGAQLGWNSNTDLIHGEHFAAFEAMHFRHNLGFTVFSNLEERYFGRFQDATALADVQRSGRGEVEIYYPTGLVPGAPDQREFDASELAAIGAINRRVLSDIRTAVNPNARIASLRNGRREMVVAQRGLGDFLALRNSEVGSVVGGENRISTYVGELPDGTRLGEAPSENVALGGAAPFVYASRMDYPSTTRMFNQGGADTPWGPNAINPTTDIGPFLANAAQALRQTIATRGLFTNFTHFHNLDDVMGTAEREAYDRFLRTQREIFDEYLERDPGFLVDHASIGRSIDYAFTRQHITEIGWSATAEGLEIRVSHDPTGLELPSGLLRSPVTIIVEAPYDNVACDACEGIRRIADGHFACDVRMDTRASGETSFVVRPVDEGDYYDFSIPVLSEVDYRPSDARLRFTVSPAARVTLFSTPSGTSHLEASALLRVRSSFEQTYVIDLAASGIDTDQLRGVDLWVGVITELGQSALVRLD